jgi:hypothetical protein
MDIGSSATEHVRVKVAAKAHPMTTRKRFLKQIAYGSFLVAMSACGGGDDDPAPAPAPGPAPAPPSPTPAPGPTPAPTPAPAMACGTLVIGTNHGHSLVIPAADLSSTTAKTYSIQGSSGHDHQITLSPAQLTMLRTAGTISVNSTGSAGDGHVHTVSGRCA